MGEVIIDGMKKTYKRGMTQREYTPWLSHLIKSEHRVGDSLSDYINRADVRKAMNIPAAV